VNTKFSAGPVVIRAASLTPAAGALTTVVGTVSSDAADATSGAIAMQAASVVVVRMTYTRHGSSTTGRPRVAIYGSIDAATTSAASVANWMPVMVLDSSSFSSGTVELYAEVQQLNPTAAGASTFGTHPVNVSWFPWMRVVVGDVDTTNPGAFTNICFGAST
jgi:hypothetical protein